MQTGYDQGLDQRQAAAPAGGSFWDSTPPPPTAGASASGMNQYGNNVNLDPAAMREQAMQLFRARGVEPTPAQMDYVLKYGANPDAYSDRKIRVGANPYLIDRAITGSDSSSVAAGDEGVINNPEQYGLGHLLGGGGGVSMGDFGSFAQGYGKNFTPPSIDEIRAMPGYQFARDEGVHALDASAAARGNVRSGGQEKEIMKFATGLADQTAQQKYQNALGEYKTAYDVFRSDRNDVFGRYDALAQRGTNAANAATS